VIVSYGVASVSAATTWIRVESMCSTSPAICAIIVSAPWPMSTVLISSVAEPSWLRLSVALAMVGVSTAFMPTAIPLP
jgi:hypothetical protein